MLLLARRLGETIIIGDDIEITIAELNSKQVRIGIEAPKNIKIVRKELLEKDKLAAQ